jgi:hypothetical protein
VNEEVLLEEKKQLSQKEAKEATKESVLKQVKNISRRRKERMQSNENSCRVSNCIESVFSEAW